jgi:hypothetical protein
LSLLTRDHDTAPTAVEPLPGPPVEPPVQTPPCATCGAAMEPGQDWCLECGAARPDRVAAWPGWAGGAAVLAVTGVLAAGAVAAAGAGLSADSKKVAASTTQAALPAQPDVPPGQAPGTTQPPPPAQTQAQPPASTKPPAAAKPPAATAATKTPPAAAAPPSSSSAPSSSSGSSTSTPPATTPKKDTTQPQHSKPVAKLTAVKLDPDNAKTYNPYARQGAENADPKQAVDGDPKTGWTSVVDSSNGKTAIGLDLDMGKLTGVRQLRLRTATPGMNIEIYGARTKDAPVSVQDPEWTHISTQLDVGRDGRIRLGDGADEYRHILVWPTEAAPGAREISLTELELFK